MRNKQKEIFDKCIEIGIPMHKFINGKRAAFFKGFKIEEATDQNGVVTYECYDTRYMVYKKLSEKEMDMILEHGVVLTSDVLSFKSYKKIIARYTEILNNSKSGYKTIEKSKKVIEHYDRVCKNLLSIHKKNVELFAQ
jgi:hypothetical protein